MNHRTMFAILVVAAILVATATLGSITSESLDSVSAAFAQDCLQGNDQNAADKVLGGGEADLKRWLLLNFPQRKNGSGSVEIADREITSDQARVRVVIEQRGQGRRMMTLYWQHVDGRWLFDSAASLSHITATD